MVLFPQPCDSHDEKHCEQILMKPWHFFSLVTFDLSNNSSEWMRSHFVLQLGKQLALFWLGHQMGQFLHPLQLNLESLSILFLCGLRLSLKRNGTIIAFEMKAIKAHDTLEQSFQYLFHRFCLNSSCSIFKWCWHYCGMCHSWWNWTDPQGSSRNYTCCLAYLAILECGKFEFIRERTQHGYQHLLMHGTQQRGQWFSSRTLTSSMIFQTMLLWLQMVTLEPLMIMWEHGLARTAAAVVHSVLSCSQYGNALTFQVAMQFALVLIAVGTCCEYTNIFPFSPLFKVSITFLISFDYHY